MMATLLGIVALVFSLLYSKDVWVENAFDFFPQAFLWAFLTSFLVASLNSFLRSPYATFSEPKKRRLRGYPIAFLGLLILFLPDWPDREFRAGLLLVLFFAWIDALKYDVKSIRHVISFDGVSQTLKQRLSKALLSKDLSKTLSEFESIALLCEKTFSSQDPQDLQRSTQLMTESVEDILSALPRITLPVADKAVESLLDRYYLFQAVVSKKLEGITSIVRSAPSDIKWDLLIKLLTKMTIIFGSIYENFGGPFLMMMGDMALFLQGSRSTKEMDAYAGCVEAIKALLDHSLQKKKDAGTIVSPLLSKLEFFMKERFRKDRTINAALLMQPFAEIGEFLSQESFLALNGRDTLMSDLKRILSQFAVLETISERMGETGQTDTSSSYHEDLPFLKKQAQKPMKEEVL